MTDEPGRSGTAKGRHVARRWGGERLAAVAVVMLTLWASAAPTLVYPLYVSLWHLTTLETTVVFATYPAAMIVSLLFLGNLSDILGGRRSMLIGLGLLAAGTLGLLLAPNLAVLVAGRALMGLGVGSALGPATVAAGRSGDDEDPHGGAVVTVATATGLVIALVLGGAAVQLWPNPLRTAFAVLLAAIVVIAALVWFAPDRPRRERASWTFEPLTVPRPRLAFVAGALSMSAAYSLGAVYLSVGAQYARDAVGSGNAAVTGIVLATSAVAIGATALLAGGLRPGASLGLGAIALTVGQTLMIVSGLTHEIWLLICASVIGGAGYGLLFTAGITIVIELAPSRHRAAATSTAYLIAYVVQAAVALSVGAISTARSLRDGLVIGSGTVLIIAIASLLLLIARRRSPSTSTTADIAQLPAESDTPAT